MPIGHREFVKLGGVAALARGVPALMRTAFAQTEPAERSDYTLRIARSLVELAPDHIVSTLTYNDQFPGPLLRFREGQRVVADVHNDTDTPEQLHMDFGFMAPFDCA